MKTFKEYLEENILQGSGLEAEKVPYDIDNPDVKNKVNAILGHVAVSEFMNPKAAVAQMESCLLYTSPSPRDRG